MFAIEYDGINISITLFSPSLNFQKARHRIFCSDAFKNNHQVQKTKNGLIMR